MKLIFTAFFFIGEMFSALGVYSCPCSNEDDCDHPEKNLGFQKEVFVFSHGTTDVHIWSWETITTLIVPSHFEVNNSQQANTMCVAHSKGRKFGITVETNFLDQINDTSTKAEDWVKSVVLQQQEWYAEVITVNLLPYFSSDISSSEQDHVALVRILNNMKINVKKLSPIVTVACIVSWTPPCAERSASCEFTSLSREVCDYFIINPDSFTDLNDVKCRARANVPFSKLFFGISEYNAHQIPNDRIILGVPWHGYDYTCDGIVINDICKIPDETNNNSTKTKCNFSTRNKVSNGDILKEHATEYERHKFDINYAAPFFTYHNTTDNRTHQVWFEDQSSLVMKYRIVAELHLKGVAVLYGDDLSPTKAQAKLMNDQDMWTWVSHEFILAESHKSLSESLHFADVTAIVSVVCLVLGVILGIVFTCLALRYRIKKPKPPFSRDMDGTMDEFTDEDPNL